MAKLVMKKDLNTYLSDFTFYSYLSTDLAFLIAVLTSSIQIRNNPIKRQNSS